MVAGALERIGEVSARAWNRDAPALRRTIRDAAGVLTIGLGMHIESSAIAPRRTRRKAPAGLLGQE